MNFRMMSSYVSKAFLLGLATLASAQGDGRNRYSPGSGYPYGGENSNNGNGQLGNAGYQRMPDKYRIALLAHGVLAALAFVIFFPAGSILVRLGSFRSLWIVHGMFQIFAYCVYIAGAGIGLWLVSNIPVNLLDNYHPIIGITVLALLAFQPILGWLHHTRFKKYKRRTVWSYGHLWLGRIVITLGMINGGLGMLLATETGVFVPSKGQMVAYGAITGVMWVLWVAASISGEMKRSKGKVSTETRTGRVMSQGTFG